jgi:divalent metal cation (Fe/Co/Zn/Cd) transporter
VHLAPEQIMVALSLEFVDDLRTPDIEARVIEVERKLRKSHPAVIAVFVKPQSAGGYEEIREPHSANAT